MKMIGDKKLSKAVSTKLTIKDYELCRKIARLYYINENINTPSVSELTRFALMRVFEEFRQKDFSSIFYITWGLIFK